VFGRAGDLAIHLVHGPETSSVTFSILRFWTISLNFCGTPSLARDGFAEHHGLANHFKIAPQDRQNLSSACDSRPH
jgi:hypothetical protein